MNELKWPEYVKVKIPSESEVRTYIPERTCHEVLVNKHWRGCSECAYKWEFMYGIGKCERPNYCPDCGAKVVDE